MKENDETDHVLLFQPAIDVLNCLGRADGKRSHWKTAKATARYPASHRRQIYCKWRHQMDNQSVYVHFSLCSHEGEMYKSLLSDYEASQRSLMLENAELKKVLQQMKKEMIHILSPRQPTTKGVSANDSLKQVILFLYMALKY